MTNAEVVKRLMMLKTKYAQDKYWNHVTETANDCYSVTNTGCTHHLIECRLNGTCGCNSFSTSIQCHGFALYMAKLVFNTFPAVSTDAGKHADGANINGWIFHKSNLTSLTLEPGDIIRTATHTAIVWTISDGKVYVAEALGGMDCIIKWGQFNFGTLETQAQILNAATYIVKAPKTIATEATVTTTFNLQGGTMSTTSKTYIPGKAYCMLPTPTKSGYVFMGWWPEADSCSQEYTCERTVPAYDHTLYAHWGKNYMIDNLGAQKYLKIADSARTELGNGLGLELGGFSYNNCQIWVLRTGTYKVIKSAQNTDYGLCVDGNTSVIHRVFGNETNAKLTVFQNEAVDGVQNYSFLRPAENSSLALTYNTSNGTLYWTTFDFSNEYQKWVLYEV